MQTQCAISRRTTIPAFEPRLLRDTFTRCASKSSVYACLLSASAVGEVVAAAVPVAGEPPSSGILEEIVVTGTRLPTHAIESIAPVTVLTRRDIERGGADSIGKALQTLPAVTGSPLNTNVNGDDPLRLIGSHRHGDGSVRAGLRSATLVLLNGRRLPNGGVGADTSVDLNSLPASWVERVEVLSGGASAIYGGDAVGGVINIITRPNRQGLELAASRTITEQGDGEIVTGQAAIGFDALGGTWSVGLDYAKQDGVTLDRRDYSATPVWCRRRSMALRACSYTSAVCLTRRSRSKWTAERSRRSTVCAIRRNSPR